MRNFAGSFASSAIAGAFARNSYDSFNIQKMIEDYEIYGLIPDKKSITIAMVLTILFGSFGLIYSSPRMAIGLSIIDIPAMLLIIPSLMIRPIVVMIAIASVISHNQMIDRLFPKERRGY